MSENITTNMWPRATGDFAELDKKLERGEITRKEYDRIFTKSREHGLDNSIDMAIGGSDAARILGISSYGGPRGLAATKLNPSLRPDTSDSMPLLIGHLFEAPVRELFSVKTGLRTEPCTIQWASRKYPHCLANTDGIVWEIDENGDEHPGIYEGKMIYNTKGEHCDAFKAGIVPDDYMIQIQFYMEVLNLNFAYINCAWGFTDGQQVYIRVKRDREFGEEICQACEDFVEASLMGKKITNSSVSNVKAFLADAELLYPKGDNTLPPVTLDPKYTATMRAIEGLQEEIKELDEQAKPLTREIDQKKKEIEKYLYPLIDVLGDATVGIIKDTATGEEWNVLYPESTSFSKDAKAMAMLRDNFPKAYDALAKFKPAARKVSMKKM